MNGRLPVVPVVYPLPLVAHLMRVLEGFGALEILDEAPVILGHHVHFAVDGVIVVRVFARLRIRRQGHLGIPGGGHEFLDLRCSVCTHSLLPPEGSNADGSDITRSAP